MSAIVWEESAAPQYKKATDLQVGEAIEGKLIDLRASEKYPNRQNLYLQHADGTVTILMPAGNLIYKITRDNYFQVGYYYRITRQESVTTKAGAIRNQFKLQRGRDDSAPPSSGPKVSNEKPE